MTLESFFNGFQRLGNNCVAAFPIGGNEAIDVLRMIGRYDESRPTLNLCKKTRGCGIVAGCSNFTTGLELSVYYFLECSGLDAEFKVRGLLLFPSTPEHELCADAALVQLAERSAAEATRNGIKLISL